MKTNKPTEPSPEPTCKWCQKPIRMGASFLVHIHDGARWCDDLRHEAEPSPEVRPNCQHEWVTNTETWTGGSETYELCKKCGVVQDQTVVDEKRKTPAEMNGETLEAWRRGEPSPYATPRPSPEVAPMQRAPVECPGCELCDPTDDAAPAVAPREPLSPDDELYNREMDRLCEPDDFNMRAGFQRGWLSARLHPVEEAVAPQETHACPSCGEWDHRRRSVCANDWHGKPDAIAPWGTQGELRDVAVEIVDAIHGYTMEYAPSPLVHREKYDLAERILRARLENGGR